jgi:membrane protein
MTVIVQLLRDSLREWGEHKAPRMGAALAYYTVFSLAPLLIIAIVISGAIFGQQQAQDRLIAQIASFIGTPGAIAINRLIDNAKLPANAGLGLTVVGVGALLLGSLGAFAQLQDAFDTIWKATPGRRRLLHLLRDRLMAFGLALIVAFLLLVLLIAQTALAAFNDYLAAQSFRAAWLEAVVNFLLPVLLATVLFALMFKFLPPVRLAWRDVWLGAALTGLLFTLGKLAISFYLSRAAFGTATGAAGSLLIVLLWVYYSAQILLFGAVFTHVYVCREARSVVSRRAVNVSPPPPPVRKEFRHG